MRLEVLDNVDSVARHAAGDGHVGESGDSVRPAGICGVFENSRVEASSAPPTVGSALKE